MHLSLALLALSSIAAAGPLPYPSNTTLAAGTAALIPANITIPTDTAAAIAKLKAVFDSLDRTAPNAASNVEHDFLAWLEDTFEDPMMKARSISNTSMLDTDVLGSDPVAALAGLKAIYDHLHENRTDSRINEKRDFDSWLTKILDSPGVHSRSFDPASTPNDNTPGSDPAAALTYLKTIYDNLHEKRTDIEKRGFWHWLKMAFEAPGLKARSSDPASTPQDEEYILDPFAVWTRFKTMYDSLPEKRTDGGFVEKRGFFHWLKMAFEAPGLKARSSNPASDKIHKKRTDGHLVEKRGFWHWFDVHFVGLRDNGMNAR